MYTNDRIMWHSVFRRVRDRAELRAIPEGLPVTIRPAYPDDALALARLADLDDARVPPGRVLVAEVGGELWAAASLDGDGAIADPFRPSGELLRALRARARARARRARAHRGRRGRGRGPAVRRDRQPA
jgi:hypothetical protein